MGLDECDTVGRLALRTADRTIVGEAAPWSADGTLRGREGTLAASMALRRQLGWDTTRKLVEPVPLALSGVPDAEIPAWQTWYRLDDLRRVFRRLYAELPTADRERRARLTAEALDEAFLWNASSVDGDPSWPADRFADYVASIDDAEAVEGLGGLSRVAYNAPAARHLLRSYPELLACHDQGPPAADLRGPAIDVPVTRQAFTLEACDRGIVGTWTLAEGESLRATVEDDGGSTLVMSSPSEACTTDASQGTCAIEGPATVEVALVADGRPVRAVVDVVRRSHEAPAWAACLDGPFPLDAAIVKADYVRADFGFPVPVHDTSADALAERLADDAAWQADRTTDPPSDAIYTLELPSGARYRLVALHVMTKELDHWLWTTLWWSDEPTTDFGADRPVDLPTPWSHYKMCVVTGFAEGDPAPGRELDGSLSDALDVVHDEATWCSNPYLELGHGNAGTNCIGCHQHGGSQLPSEAILELEDRGRREVRTNFPTDYSFAATQGDDLTQMFADTELYWLGVR